MRRPWDRGPTTLHTVLRLGLPFRERSSEAGGLGVTQRFGPSRSLGPLWPDCDWRIDRSGLRLGSARPNQCRFKKPQAPKFLEASSKLSLRRMGYVRREEALRSEAANPGREAAERLPEGSFEDWERRGINCMKW